MVMRLTLLLRVCLPGYPPVAMPAVTNPGGLALIFRQYQKPVWHWFHQYRTQESLAFRLLCRRQVTLRSVM